MTFLQKSSGLLFCRAFVVIKFHSGSVDFVVDFCVNFFCGFLGAFVPLNEGQKIHREIHSKIHNKIPAKSTHVMKNGVGKSTLQEEGPEKAQLARKRKELQKGVRGQNRLLHKTSKHEGGS